MADEVTADPAAHALCVNTAEDTAEDASLSCSWCATAPLLLLHRKAVIYELASMAIERAVQAGTLVAVGSDNQDMTTLPEHGVI